MVSTSSVAGSMVPGDFQALTSLTKQQFPLKVEFILKNNQLH